MGTLLVWLGLMSGFYAFALLVVFVVLLATGKKKIKFAIAAAVCAVLVLPLWISGAIIDNAFMSEEERLAKIESYNKEVAEYNTMIETQKNETTSSQDKKATESKKKTSSKEKNTESKKETSKKPVEKEDTMISQFKELGFTDTESQKMKEIFTTVGITEISNIQAVGNNGIDKLQAFKSDIYDYRADKGGISIHFTIDKRQLCFISLDGIATTKFDYAYINIFGNVKFKTSNATKSVTLYDIWDENGEIIPDAIGYKAVFDYKNKKITNYE